MNHPRLFLALAFPLLFSMPASAAVLSSIDVSAVGGGGAWGEATDARFTFDIGGALYNGEYGGTVFDLLLSSSDSGKSFLVSSGTEFEEAAAFLTNGTNDVISWVFAGGGTGTTEAYLLFGDSTGAQGIDFAGYQIDGLSLNVDTLTFTYHPDGWRTHDFIANVTINGTPPIPEPETNALMMAGLAAMCIGFSRRRTLALGQAMDQPRR